MNDLRILHLEKKYSKTAAAGQEPFVLQPVDLTIREAEFFTLLGPSGCGKTTLLKLVAGLLQADSGQLWLGDSELTAVPPEDRRFSMVFQQPLLFPHMTIEDNVAFGLKMQKVKRKKRLSLAQEMLEFVGLAGFESRFPDGLSGGQQQRVALARALVADPRLLLMDEPFSALDPGLREEMRELLSRIQKQLGVTVLFVTHDREEAFELSDRIGIMGNGRLLQVGTAMELYELPASTQIARFLGMKNIIPGTVHGGRFISNEGVFEFSAGNSVKAGEWCLILRPEALQLLAPGTPAPAGALLVRGEVGRMKFHHGLYQCKLHVGGAQLDCTLSRQQAESLAAGQVYDFFVLPDDLHLVGI
ncbi:ABC transporter ATP-binding protein [Planococcus salinarum]|uniref:ABC transporter ATP-binding protein n=1 Tax=Planococcus salinarum TaxID=622695 RepID=UPI000E3C753A|nr:ABC transporter ATP-binding protein [Planococcus salinarum]TAA70505.1 ABC transporter ATP-binding protein [Planococcus salinarum]